MLSHTWVGGMTAKNVREQIMSSVFCSTNHLIFCSRGDNWNHWVIVPNMTKWQSFLCMHSLHYLLLFNIFWKFYSNWIIRAPSNINCLWYFFPWQKKWESFQSRQSKIEVTSHLSSTRCESADHFSQEFCYLNKEEFQRKTVPKANINWSSSLNWCYFQKSYQNRPHIDEM